MNQTQLEAIMNEPGLTKKRAVISIAIAVICHAVWISVVLHMCCCYNPDLSKVRYTCSVTHPLCPDGQECIEGWCGGPPPSVSPPPDMMAAPADGSMPPTPDMASECPMCKSGRCKLLRGGVMGCYFTPGTSASLQCQGTHRIAIVLPFATDTDCQ